MKRLTAQEIMNLYPSAGGMEKLPYTITLTEEADICKMIHPRPLFAHKGTMGHALLVSGQYGMAGATILSARACMKSGVGKLTIHTAGKNNDILQMAVPEAIMSHDKCAERICESIPTTPYDAMAIGPGMGTHEETATAFYHFVAQHQGKLVIDADGINILSTHPQWMKSLPKGSILTPHAKEWERLAGESEQLYDSVEKAVTMAEAFGIYIVLKGHHTMICSPHRTITINPTGNAGMATAGSGDVLTGILCGLLARGYEAHETCLIGVYLHGLAGDLAAEQLGMESMTASDIVSALPAAYKKYEQKI